MRPAANPYRWDVVEPSIFYGRRDAARYLGERLVAGDRFAVVGGRRMGKTTLLRRLEADLGGVARSGGLVVLPVFIDANELCAGSAADAYRLLTRRVRSAARDAGVVTPAAAAGAEAASDPAASDEGADGPTFAESLLGLVRAARPRGRLQLVFLFDEVERVLATDWGGGFLAHWRMLLNNMGELSRSVSAVFCGAGGVYRIARDAGSPLGNILAWHELELFTRDETALLVREPCRHRWPDALVEHVYDRSGGHPCLIQYLMQRACDRDVEEWPAAVAQAERGFLREHAPMFGNWWDSFGDDARAIYARLAQQRATSEGELIARWPDGGKRALDVLAHTGVIRWDRAARRVEIAGALFERWATDAASSRGVGAVAASGVDRHEDAARSAVVTVLFTDIVGSTATATELGDRRWRDVLDDHNVRVRAALAAFGGREVKSTGDGFLAVFDGPAAAIRCACAIVGSIRSLGIEVRAGLHAGEHETIGDDIVGLAVNYGAWVMSKANAGEVVVSDTVKGLVAGSGIRFVDRGAHRPKGSRQRRRLFAVDRAEA